MKTTQGRDVKPFWHPGVGFKQWFKEQLIAIGIVVVIINVIRLFLLP